MSKRDFTRSEFGIDFGGISYIATAQGYHKWSPITHAIDILWFYMVKRTVYFVWSSSKLLKKIATQLWKNFLYWNKKRFDDNIIFMFTHEPVNLVPCNLLDLLSSTATISTNGWCNGFPNAAECLAESRIYASIIPLKNYQHFCQQ